MGREEDKGHDQVEGEGGHLRDSVVLLEVVKREGKEDEVGHED